MHFEAIGFASLLEISDELQSGRPRHSLLRVKVSGTAVQASRFPQGNHSPHPNFPRCSFLLHKRKGPPPYGSGPCPQHAPCRRNASGIAPSQTDHSAVMCFSFTTLLQRAVSLFTKVRN